MCRYSLQNTYSDANRSYANNRNYNEFKISNIGIVIAKISATYIKIILLKTGPIVAYREDSGNDFEIHKKRGLLLSCICSSSLLTRNENSGSYEIGYGIIWAQK